MRDTLAAALAKRFFGLLIVGFVAFAATVTLATLGAMRLMVPALSLPDLLGLVSDALVAALPLASLLVGCLATAVTVHQASQSRLLLTVALAGRRPWHVFWPILVSGVIGSTLLLAVVNHAAPEARYRLRFPVAETETGMADLLANAANTGWQGRDFSFRCARAVDGVLHDVALTRDNTAIACDRARLDEQEDGQLQLTMEQGRLLQQDSEVSLNLSFESLTLRQSMSDLVRPDKSQLLSLAYYNNDELDRYGMQVRSLQERGINVADQIQRRASSKGTIIALRLTSAAHLALSIAVLVLILARPQPVTRKAISVAVTAIIAGALVQLLLESRAYKAADLPGPWVALASPLTTLVGAAMANRFNRRTQAST